MRKIKKIKISPKNVKNLANDFNVTPTMVYYSLGYRSQSALSEKIRIAAKKQYHGIEIYDVVFDEV